MLLIHSITAWRWGAERLRRRRLRSTCSEIVIDGCAALVTFIEEVIGRAASGADSNSARAACIALAVAEHIHVCHSGVSTAILEAAHIQTVAARKLPEIEEQSLATLIALGVRVVLDAADILADIVVAA